MPTLPDTQVFFINFMCMPSFKDLIEFEPEAQEAVDNLEWNLIYWKDQKEKLEQSVVEESAERSEPKQSSSSRSCFCFSCCRSAKGNQETPRTNLSQDLKED